MRLPACLEQEIFNYAHKRLAELDSQFQMKPREGSSDIKQSIVANVKPLSNQKTTVVELSLRVENNSKFVRRKKR